MIIGTSRFVDRTWSGAVSPEVDIYRNGQPFTVPNVDTGPNTHTDELGRTKESSFTHQVCEFGTNVCSNSVAVTF